MEESKTTGTPRDPAELKAELAANGPSNGSSNGSSNGANGDVKADGDAPKTSPEKVKGDDEPVAGPSTSPTKQDVQVVNQAMQYLAAGKRDLLIQDPSSAVASLAQSCELLGEHYGETAPECGEAYYYYGRALLDLARVEAGVIDNVLDGVPEDESEEPDSMVEDPDECSEEEKVKVANDVGQALEENFEELEKMRKKKEKEAPLMKGEEIEITNKVRADSEGEKEAGDSFKDNEGLEKKEGDNPSKPKDEEEEGDVEMPSEEVEESKQSLNLEKTGELTKDVVNTDSKMKGQEEGDISEEAGGSTKKVSSPEKKVEDEQSERKEKKEEGEEVDDSTNDSSNIGTNRDSKAGEKKEEDDAKVKEGNISEEAGDSEKAENGTKEAASPGKKVGDEQSKRKEKKEDDVDMESEEVENSTNGSLNLGKNRDLKAEEKKEEDNTKLKKADISEEAGDSTKAENETKEVPSPEKKVGDKQSKNKEKKEDDDVEMESEEVENSAKEPLKHEKNRDSKPEEKKDKCDAKMEDVKEGNISEGAGDSFKAEEGMKEVLPLGKKGNDQPNPKDRKEGGDVGIKTKENLSPRKEELKEKVEECDANEEKGKDRDIVHEAGDSKKVENETKDGLESKKKVGSGQSGLNEKSDNNSVDMDPAEESEENSADDEDGDEEPEGEGEEKAEEEDGDEKKEEAEEEDGKDESIASDTEANTVAKDTGDAAAVDKEDEEDPSNLQLSWEMLELAKTIFMKQAKDMKAGTEKEREAKFNVESRICDIFQTLGELSIENENYEQAIEDLQTCLERRQKLLPEDSRLIAETFYQLGVAQGFSIRFDDAVESLMSAIGVLQTRVENLKVEKESKDPAKKNDAFYTREGEIKELEGLIPEIREKIADTKDMKEETRKKLGDRRLMEEEICSAAFKAANGSSAAATNGEGSSKTISTLQVKKRKKSGGDEKGSEAKKPHLETSSSNGHGPSTSK